MKRVLKKKRFYIFTISLLLFLVIMYFIIKKDILGIDNYFYNFIKNKLVNDKLTSIIKVITNLGSSISIIIMIITSFFIIQNKKIVCGIICNTIIALFLDLLIKYIIKRDRPLIDNHLIDVIGYSFPSGHAMVSMSFFGFIIYLLYVYWNNKYKWLVIMLLGLIIIMIGFSRIYLGVHYLSDVLAGYFVSIIYLVFFITVYEKIINSTKSWYYSTN